MNSNEEKLIRALQKQALDYDPTLQPHSFYEDKFAVNNFYVDGHEELMLTVRGLIYLCQLAINPELATKESSGMQQCYIQQTLSIAGRLMPIGEEALLDQLNIYYRNEGLRKRS